MASQRGGALGLVALLCALALPCGSALAAEQANAPTVTGETGLFSLLTGDTLPRGGRSFGLYYNNWDRIAPLTGPEPGDPGVPYRDPSLDPFNALLSSARTARDFNTILLPQPDRLTSESGDILDLGVFPLGGTSTRDFFTEIFRPADPNTPQQGADQAPP